MFENCQANETGKSLEDIPIPAQNSFDNTIESFKIEDIDFYKLSMIAGGGNDPKIE